MSRAKAQRAGVVVLVLAMVTASVLGGLATAPSRAGSPSVPAAGHASPTPGLAVTPRTPTASGPEAGNFTVLAEETGLPTALAWSATLDNRTLTSHNTSLSFSLPNGNYSFNVIPTPGYLADPSYERVTVNGTGLTLRVVFAATGPSPFTTGMPASVVLGQRTFWTAGPGSVPANASAFRDPGYAIAFDSYGDLWVADWGDNRVLEFVPPFSNGMAASLVLGQSTFLGTAAGTTATNLSDPDGLAFDAHGNLWVSDYANNRVLEYLYPFANGEAASTVIGQGSFTTGAPGVGTVGFDGPSQTTFFNGTLWVTDYHHNRVMGFPAPQTTNESARIVIGQSDFDGIQAGTTAVNLSTPSTVVADAHGDLWVADTGNDRALEFKAPITTGEAASVVLGQGNFTTSNFTLPYHFEGDYGVSVDSRGNVWVADSDHSRVLEFLGPTFTTNQSPAVVLGQGNLSGGLSSLGPSGLDEPTIAAADPHGNIWVDDEYNYRLLGYIPAEYRVTFDAVGASLPSSWNLTVNGTTTTVRSASQSVATINGTLTWSAAGPRGWSVTPRSGALVVNGANEVVNLTFLPLTYDVNFTETGLAAGTNWSVTLGGVTHFSTGTTIVFAEGNGSYGYTIANVSGYSLTPPASGSVLVSGVAVPVSVTFTALPPSSSSSTSAYLWAGIGAAVVVIAALAVLLLLRRRKKGGATPVEPMTPASSAGEGSSSGGPPPGAVG